MKMQVRWLVGIGLGASVGYLFGLQRGDPWIGGVLAAVWAIAGYGVLAFPEYRTRWSSSRATGWYTLVGVLSPVVMLLPPNSALLSDDLPVVILLGGIWLGGVYAGVALERESAGRTDT
jgi:hypothetical protein